MLTQVPGYTSEITLRNLIFYKNITFQLLILLLPPLILLLPPGRRGDINSLLWQISKPFWGFWNPPYLLVWVCVINLWYQHASISTINWSKNQLFLGFRHIRRTEWVFKMSPEIIHLRNTMEVSLSNLVIGYSHRCYSLSSSTLTD